MNVVFEAIAVADLPPFHNAFTCEYSDRFKDMYDDAKRHGRVWDHRGLQEVGRQFLMTITEVEAAVCSYHRANWADIAEQSVRIIREHGPPAAR